MKGNDKRPFSELFTKLVSEALETTKRIENRFLHAIALARIATEIGALDLLGRPIASLEGSVSEHGSSQSPPRGLEETEVEPVLEVGVVKGVLVDGEDLEVEIRSNVGVENVLVEFQGVKAQPVRLARLEKGVTRVRTRPESEPGRKRVTVSITYDYRGERRRLSKVFDVEFRPLKTAEKPPERAVAERVFGKYRILSLIGSGAFADVYVAVNEKGGRVALKIYRGAEKAFLDEIGNFVQLTRKLQGIPYIVRPLDYDVSPAPYVVMELYPSTLRSLIGENIELKKKIKLLLRIAWALSQAHSQRIYHGDLKPENILVREESGEYYPAIADWGGGFTPCYSAPEVYESGGKQISDKSDVWSFGVIMYELLTGDRLFKDPLDYVEKTDVDVKVSLFISELNELVNSCLLRDPIKRPSMSHVSSFLEKYLTNFLKSSISKKITADTAVELIGAYLTQGELEEARRCLRIAKSRALVPVNVLVLLEKFTQIYELIYEHHGRVLPVEKLEVAWRNMLDHLDQDIKEKLLKDRYSIEMCLAMRSEIPPEMHKGLLTCLERARNLLVSHYLKEYHLLVES